MPLLELSAGGYDLTIAPQIGGSLRSFTWEGKALLRTAAGPSVLDAACFPLVPFPNRIAHGRFAFGGEKVQLLPNFPGRHHIHPLHGFGWVSEWDVICADASSVELEHRYAGGDWPWPYVARQTISLSEKGLELELSVENISDPPMPAGLGFHPYFPRNDRTMLRALHRAEWQTDVDCLPIKLLEASEPMDWWDGQPVGSRLVDTVYSGRAGDIEILWPDRTLMLTMRPAPALQHTGIFVPADEDWFCVEPVSQETDAFNAHERSGPFTVLQQGQVFRVGLALFASAGPPGRRQEV